MTGPSLEVTSRGETIDIDRTICREIVASTWQWHQMRTRDERCETPSFLEIDRLIVTAVDHQSACPNLREDFSTILPGVARLLVSRRYLRVC